MFVQQPPAMPAKQHTMAVQFSTGNCLWGGMDLCINRRQTQTFNKYLKPHTISLSPSMATEAKQVNEECDMHMVSFTFEWLYINAGELIGE